MGYESLESFNTEILAMVIGQLRRWPQLSDCGIIFNADGYQ